MKNITTQQQFNEVSEPKNDNVVQFPVPFERDGEYNSRNPAPNRDPDDEYIYRTAEGWPAYVVQRWGSGDDKAFRIQHTVGYGNVGPGEDLWQSGFGDAGPLLYRLSELVASPPDTAVYLCEGEKDADTAAARGLIATTNPNGALHWNEEFSKALAGRKVVVVEDNDQPGRERTERILRTLRKHAASVSIIRFSDQPEKSDITDFLQAGHSLEELQARIKSAGPDFQRNEKGVPYPNQHNVRLALERLGVMVRHDVFKDMLNIEGLDNFGPELSDAALTRLRLLADERFHLKVAKDYFIDIVSDAARQNSFHPVCDYLDSLTWDGIPRLNTWLCTYGGAEDSKYVRAIGAIILIAAVRRVRQPGCKFDEMLILESEQGKDKSSALAILAVKEEWFSDDLPLNQDSQRVIERMAGHWIVEAAELNGMRKGNVEHLKAFMSRRVDRARPAYGRIAISIPRQNVFFGTDNGGGYLQDPTGNRRFWPVAIEQFDLVALRRDVDQLWAEAASREAAGESIRLPKELWPSAAIEQEERRIDDPFVDMLQDCFGEMEGKVKAEDVWIGLSVQPAQRTPGLNTRLIGAMKELGWTKTKRRFGEKKTEVAYTRGDAERRIHVHRGSDGRSGKAFYDGELAQAVNAIDEAPF